MSEARDLEAMATDAPEASDRDGRGGDEHDVEIVSFGDDAEGAPVADADPGLEQELAEMRESFLRLRADFDNFRKRSERDREERLRRGVAETMRELLPVADNLERALVAEGGPEDLRRGVEMIARQLAEVLRRQGVVAVEALGQSFDPQLHEAVAREESAEVGAPTVVAEFQRGYRHGERLLRPAMVKVAMPAAGAVAAPPGGAPEGDAS